TPPFNRSFLYQNGEDLDNAWYGGVEEPNTGHVSVLPDVDSFGGFYSGRFKADAGAHFGLLTPHLQLVAHDLTIHYKTDGPAPQVRIINNGVTTIDTLPQSADWTTWTTSFVPGVADVRIPLLF